MRHKDTIELYRYWDEIRRGREAPSRADITPAALGRLLASVMLLQDEAGEDATFRLAGTRLCSLRCAELKGKPFSSLFQRGDRATVERIARSVMLENAIVVLDAEAQSATGSEVAMEMLLLPLADETTRAVGIASLAQTPYWLGLEPADLGLRGIRYMNPEASLPFLQNRPSVPMVRRADDAEKPGIPGFRVVSGSGLPGPARTLRAFRVFDGGKK